ncbi:MAG TPA: MMPL family transporter [Polyangia bacterium]|nr:MMPL family transporter [Polyangia bacterium]
MSSQDHPSQTGPGQRTRRYVRWTLRHGALLWLIALAVAVPAGVAMVNLYRNLSSDIDELLPREAPSVRALEELRARLPGLATLGIVVDAGEPSKLPAAEQFLDALAARIRAYPSRLVRAVRTGRHEEKQFFDRFGPLFIGQRDLVEIRRQLEGRRSWETRHRLGITFDDPQPPPLQVSEILQKYEKRYLGSKASASGRFSLAQENPREALSMVLVEATEFASSARVPAELLSRVKADIAALGGPQHYAPGMRVGFSGNVAVSSEELSALAQDLGVSSVLVILAVLAVIVLYFRWWSAIPILFLPLGIATVLAFGVVSLPPFGVQRLNSSTGFLGSIVVGNGINFGVIWLARYAEARRRAATVETALAEAVWGAFPGTIVAAVAAATSYASLMVTQFRGFNQFGAIGAVGMIACWGMTYLLAPPLVAWVEARFERKHGSRRPAAPRPRLATTVIHALLQRRNSVLLIAAVITAGALFELRSLNTGHIESDFSRLRRRDTWTSGEGYWGRKMDRLVGGNLTPTVVLTNSRQEASAVATALRAAADQPPLGGLVEKIRALDDLLPPDQPKKIEDLKQLRRLFTPTVRAQLTPEQLALVERFLDRDLTTLRPVRFEDLPPSLMAGLRERDGTLGRTVLVFPVLTKRMWQTGMLESFIGGLRRVAAEAVPPGAQPGRVAGYLPLAADITRSLRRDGPMASLLALAAVTAVVLAIFRGSGSGFLVLGSLLLAITWMIGATLLLGLKINYVNFAAFPITFGIGVDYAVNIMARYRQAQKAATGPPGAAGASLDEGLASTARAVTLCSLTTIIGYSSLLLAKNHALFLFGVVAVMGEIACLSTALLVLSAALRAFAARGSSSPASRRYHQAPR